MSTQFIVMGVSGCGKSTLGAALARQWNVPFIEGDELHSAENVAKMSAGIALSDDDRWPWLDRIGASMVDARSSGRGGVASCSALRRIYRDRLRQHVGQHLRFVMIDLSRDVLARRMQQRSGHYMPPALLDSQLRTLERPVGETDVLVVDGAASAEQMVAEVAEWRLALLKSGETW